MGRFLSDDVKQEQEALIALGYDLGSDGATGVMGPQTKAALAEFKKTMDPSELKSTTVHDALLLRQRQENELLQQLGFKLDEDRPGHIPPYMTAEAFKQFRQQQHIEKLSNADAFGNLRNEYIQDQNYACQYSSSTVSYTVADVYKARTASATISDFDYKMRMGAYYQPDPSFTGPIDQPSVTTTQTTPSVFEQNKTVSDSLLLPASRFLHLHEQKDNKVLSSYLSTNSGVGKWNPAGDANPWCAVYVNSVLGECGIKGTHSAGAQSFLKFGNEVTKENTQAGDIVVLKRFKDGKVVPGGGHVGFVVGRHYDEKTHQYMVTVLGGNQGNSVSVQDYPEKNVLGYRRLSEDDQKKLNDSLLCYKEQYADDKKLQQNVQIVSAGKPSATKNQRVL